MFTENNLNYSGQVIEENAMILINTADADYENPEVVDAEVVEEAEIVSEPLNYYQDMDVEKLRELGAYYEFVNGQSVPLSDEELLKMGEELANLNRDWNDEDLERKRYTELATAHKKSATELQEKIQDIARDIKVKRKPVDGDYFFLEDFKKSVIYVYDKSGKYCDTRSMTEGDRQRKMHFDTVNNNNQQEEQKEDISNEYEADEDTLQDIEFVNSDEDEYQYQLEG